MIQFLALYMACRCLPVRKLRGELNELLALNIKQHGLLDN